jgi:hypothetical protein
LALICEKTGVIKIKFVGRKMYRKVQNVENQSSECRWDSITIHANMMRHKKENVK